jgi:hypothetical protein
MSINRVSYKEDNRTFFGQNARILFLQQVIFDEHYPQLMAADFGSAVKCQVDVFLGVVPLFLN